MTTNEAADQNTDNLEVVRTVLTQTATLLHNVSVPLAVVEQVDYTQVYTITFVTGVQYFYVWCMYINNSNIKEVPILTKDTVYRE